MAVGAVRTATNQSTIEQAIDFELKKLFYSPEETIETDTMAKDHEARLRKKREGEIRWLRRQEAKVCENLHYLSDNKLHFLKA